MSDCTATFYICRPRGACDCTIACAGVGRHEHDVRFHAGGDQRGRSYVKSRAIASTIAVAITITIPITIPSITPKHEQLDPNKERKNDHEQEGGGVWKVVLEGAGSEAVQLVCSKCDQQSYRRISVARYSSGT